MNSTDLPNIGFQTESEGKPAREHWWRCLFDLSEDGLVICDRECQVLEANPGARQLLGLPDPCRRRTVGLQSYLPTPAAAWLRSLLQTKFNRVESLAAVTILAEGKRNLLADLQLMPLDEQCWLATIKDTSRRGCLESHAQRLAAALDVTPEVVYLTDSDFRINFVNAAFQSATGYSIEETLGRSSEFLRAPGQAEITRLSVRAVKSGRHWVGELRNQRADGTRYLVEASIAPIPERNGEWLGFAFIEREITATQPTPAPAARESILVTSILNSLDGAVYVVDRQFRLTHASDTWKRLPIVHGWLDWTVPPQAGHSLLAHAAAEGRVKLPLILEQVLESGEARQFVVHDEPAHEWLVDVVPWRDGGEIRGLIYRVTNDTHGTEFQNQLHQAQRMGTLGALADGVAHDFNNLLTAILGNAGLLLMDKSLPEKTRERLQLVDQAAQRAAGLTRQLLSFSRASAEQIVVLDFNEVIEEAGRMLQRTLRGKTRVNLVHAPSAVRVRMDSTRAQQVLLNLGINAMDAMPAGGTLTICNSLVAISAQQAAKARQPVGTSFVRCSIADTGHGIPAGVLPRIFEPGFTTRQEGEGAGLGLSIAQHAVIQAGGFIEVETAVGRGTTFHLHFPEVRSTVPARSGVGVPAPAVGAGRILVVDDLDFVLDLTKAFFTQAGFDVLVADSAESALKVMDRESRPVNLLFTDYSMPGMDGRELIHAAAARWPHMKFILSTGLLAEDERQRIVDEHGIRILQKPFNLSEAAAMVSAMLAP